MFKNIITAKSARFIWKIGEKYLYLPRDIIIRYTTKTKLPQIYAILTLRSIRG